MTTFPGVLCVGMHFRGGDAVRTAAELTEDAVLRLEREPENAHDSYAIKVMFEDMHLGYIERGQAGWIAPLMDDGGEPVVRLTGHEQRGKNSHPVLEIVIE
jgi:hypothetical protein